MSEEVRRLFRIAKGRSAEQTNSSTPTTTTGNSSSGNSTAGQLSGSSSSHSNVGATGSSSKRNIFQQCINYRRASTSSASPTLPNHHDEHSGHEHEHCADRGAPFSRQQSCTTECRKVNNKPSMESSSSSSSSSTAKPKLPPRPATVASSAPRTSSSAICTVQQQHPQQRHLHQQHSPAISTSSSSVESSPLPPTVMSQYPFQHHQPQDQQQRRPGPPAELIMRPNSVPPPTLSSDRCANRSALEGPDEGVIQGGRDDGPSSTQSESLVSISSCRHHTVGRCQCHLLVSLCPHQQSKCIILVSLTYHLLL